MDRNAHVPGDVVGSLYIDLYRRVAAVAIAGHLSQVEYQSVLARFVLQEAQRDAAFIPPFGYLGKGTVDKLEMHPFDSR